MPPAASDMDPVVLQMMRQQMLLTQSDGLRDTGICAKNARVATAKPAVGRTIEKLTMDTKWIPAAPMPDWKSWSNRARELSGFKGWLEKFCIVALSCP